MLQKFRNLGHKFPLMEGCGRKVGGVSTKSLGYDSVEPGFIQSLGTAVRRWG